MIKINPDIVLNKYIKNRINANKNWLGVMCGATGSGKSYWSLAACERHFPRFTVDNVVFSVKEYLNKFTECKPGDIILFDEGEEWSSRRSMDEKNVLFTNILSMIRFTQISSIFTLPDIRQIDVTLVRLMHNYMYSIDIDRKTCPLWMRTRSGVNFYEIIKEKLPKGDSRDLKTRFPRMELIIKNNTTGQFYEKTVKVRELWYKAPSKELLEDYETRKKEHFDRTMHSVKQRLKAKDEKDRRRMIMTTGIDPDMTTPVQSASPELPAGAEAASQNIINSIIGES
jgi:hypothetical protein